MPLPPALAARLRKRGLIQVDAQEEIIAESYDDGQDSQSSLAKAAIYAVGCPNKNNPFHQCVEYCHIHWGDGVVPESRKDEIYERRRQRMLRKYPLPSSDWKEIYDPGIGRYYYWNTLTDDVCWLSPTHPKARITKAAPNLAKIEWEKLSRERKSKEQEGKRPKTRYEKGGFSRRRKRSLSPESVDESEDGSDASDEDNDRGRRKKFGKRKRNELDPMDPASYSDIAPGGWSSGLETRGDAKTGADTTANGPLFQQRPYPAPGAILRQNQDTSKKPVEPKGPQIGPVNPYLDN